MNEVVLKSWRPGLNTVSLILLVRKHAHMGLAESKKLVERFLAGERVVLSFPTSAAKSEFLQVMETLGVTVVV